MDSAAQRKYTTGKQLPWPSDAGKGGGYLLATESPWRDSRGFALPQLLDHGQHFLPGEDAFALQQLHQRRGFPCGGDGEFFDGDEVVGVEGFSHDATARVEAVQLRQWSQHKAAPILLRSGRKGDSRERASAYVDKPRAPHPQV